MKYFTIFRFLSWVISESITFKYSNIDESIINVENDSLDEANDDP